MLREELFREKVDALKAHVQQELPNHRVRHGLDFVRLEAAIQMWYPQLEDWHIALIALNVIYRLEDDYVLWAIEVMNPGVARTQ